MSGICGWAGRILWVDLTSGKVWAEATAKYAEDFLGGRGLAAKIAWDILPVGTHAFDADNPLIFTAGLLTGTGAPSCGRVTCCTVSPMSYPDDIVFDWSSSQASAQFGGQMKLAGFDGIVVTGKSPSPVYIWAHDGQAELVDATSLWGQDTYVTQFRLMKKHGKDCAVAAIGPAGERLCRHANFITSSGQSWSQAGPGAVAGSKKLKAIVCYGSGLTPLKIANPKELLALRKKATSYHTPDDFEYRVGLYGKDHPYSTWSSALTIKSEECLRPDNCHSCGGFDRIVREIPGKVRHASQCGEFWIFGDKPEISIELQPMASQLGMCYRGFSVVRAWLQSMSREGMLTDEEAGFPVLSNTREHFTKLMYDIAYRSGKLGNILAEEAPRAADILKKGHEQLWQASYVHRGNYLAYGYDCRQWPLVALGCAFSYSRAPYDIHHVYEWVYKLGRQWDIPDEKWQKGRPHDADGNLLPTLMYAPLLTAEDGVNVSEKWFGSKDAFNYLNWEGKAIGFKNCFEYAYIKDALGQCDWWWPIYASENVPHPTTEGRRYFGGLLREEPLELEAQMVNAATGKNIDSAYLRRVADRTFLLWRALQMRTGICQGKTTDVIDERFFTEPMRQNMYEGWVFDAEGKYVKATVVDKVGFEKGRDEFYQLMGWDVAQGQPTRRNFEELGLKDVADKLEGMGFLPQGKVQPGGARI